MGIRVTGMRGTTGAIYGQIAGAFYGIEQIPPESRVKLTMRDFTQFI
jgi:ADP-ribosylglycohydrolase